MRKIGFSYCLLPLLYLLPLFVMGQGDDLLSVLEAEEGQSTDVVSATFKGTRIVHTASVDIHPKGELLFMISHRFGPISSGAKRFWGLDDALVRLGLEYGITDRWALALGRSGQEATYDLSSKYKLLRQRTGASPFPFTLVWNANTALKGGDFDPDGPSVRFGERICFIHQLLIAHKFLKRGISLQLSPTFAYNNISEFGAEKQDNFFLGIAARVRMSRRVSLIGDYYQHFGEGLGQAFREPLALAVEIETGGHVFHIIFSNSYGMTEKLFLLRTLKGQGSGDIHFGFNISRTFPIKKSRK